MKPFLVLHDKLIHLLVYLTERDGISPETATLAARLHLIKKPLARDFLYFLCQGIPLPFAKMAFEGFKITSMTRGLLHPRPEALLLLIGQSTLYFLI